MIKPKPEIMNTPSAYHGAFDYDELAQLKLSDEDVIDFSVNSNPYGPPPGVKEAIANVSLDRYPDKECLALRYKLAELHQVNIENIVVGNGTAELLLLIALAFIRPKDDVLIIEPTFGEYERVSRLADATIHKLILTYKESFDTEIVNYLAHIKGKKVVFDCNPNNPTGLFAPKFVIEKFINANPDTLFVLDVAYRNFSEGDLTNYGSDGLVPEVLAHNLLTVYSMTKDYALAGLRLGYVIGEPEMIEPIRRLRPAWNVNSLAQAAGLAALNSGTWLSDTVNQLHEDKKHLVTELEALGYKPFDYFTHYFMLYVGNANLFRSQLLKQKIMVRDCTSFGLPEWVRISTRKPDDNKKLLDAIKAIHDDR